MGVLVEFSFSSFSPSIGLRVGRDLVVRTRSVVVRGRRVDRVVRSFLVVVSFVVGFVGLAGAI